MKALDGFSDFIAMLMWGPKTAPQLADAVGCVKATAYGRLESLHAAGVVRKAGKTSAGAQIWAMQATPFGTADVE